MSYKTRFIPEDKITELINIWHLSKVPTSGMIQGRRHKRMVWTAAEFAKKYDLKSTGVYKDLECLLEGY